jgi:hypothetical protein
MEIITLILFVFTGLVAFVHGDEAVDTIANMIGWAGAWVLGFFLFQA